MDEFGVIADIFAPLASPFGFGLKDDAAAIPSRPGEDIVITTDAISEGVDFFAFDPAADIARKALRVNLSDLAAKGAAPRWYLLNIALPHSMTMEWLKAFAGGLADDQKQFGISLLGGDTSRTEGPLSIAVTAIGAVPQGGMIRRKGARPGDGVFVTGEIGMSAGGLAIFRRENHALSELDRDALIARYRVPQPPVAFGERLRGLASAAIDVSDGLMADLGHLAKASEVRIEIAGERIPLPESLKSWWGEKAIARAAVAGDDYQIAFTADQSRQAAILATARETGVTVTRIGHAEAGEGAHLLFDGIETALPQTGHRHF